MKKIGLLFLFFHTISFGQSTKIDSLLKQLKKEKNELVKMSDYDQLSWEYKNIGNYDSAMYYAKISLDLATKLNSFKGKANAYGKIGNVYEIQGNYLKSLEYYFKSLKSKEKINDKNGIAAVTGNIGIVYYRQGNYSKTIEYYKKALKLSKELGNKNDEAIWLNNIGLIYCNQNEFEKSIVYFLKASKLFEDLKNQIGISNCYNNLGLSYEGLKEYEKAKEFYYKSLVISEKNKDKNGITTNLGNIGSINIKLKNYQDAKEYLFKALQVAKEIGYPEAEKEWYSCLSSMYSETKDYQNSLNFYKKFIAIKDSLSSEESKKQIIEISTKFETEKKEQQIKLLKSDKEKQEAITIADTKRKNTILFSVIIGLVLVIVFSISILKRFRISQKQKAIIEIQKKEVEIAHNHLEEKNREILDSITYAKRIQSAILPQPKLVKEYFKDSFILYKPKDIVAGDFYWFEVIDDLIFFAAADCTGHGVPGAIVSVVCHNALNRSVKEYSLKNPAEILDKTCEIVISEFEKSEEEVKDGMDISLCAINLNTNLLSWSGAHNPLWILRNKEIIEIKADKQPIGKFSHAKAFTKHEIELLKDDEIYIFTDGFQDQFGGDKQKKYKASQMRDLLLTLNDVTMDQKRTQIDASFETWKGDLDQVDDVCVIGVRL